MAGSAFHWRVWGLCTEDVLSSTKFQPPARDLDCVELWSGVGAVCGAAKVAGFRSEAFDMNRLGAVDEDILTEFGFHKALALVLRLKPRGLLWMAPVCSSWLFLNLINTQRQHWIWGNTSYRPVRQGNDMAITAAFLYVVAAKRGVAAAMENPAASWFFKFPPVLLAGKLVGAHACVTPRCAWSSEVPGRRFLKRYKLLATGAWIYRLHAACPCRNRGHLSLVSVRCSSSGKKRVTGRRSLLIASAAYPPALGKAIVEAWSTSQSRLPALAAPAAPPAWRVWRLPSASHAAQAAPTQAHLARREWRHCSSGVDGARCQPVVLDDARPHALVSGRAWKKP